MSEQQPKPGTFDVMVRAYRCRCGHEWLPRVFKEKRPRVCPRCKSPNWDKDFKFRRIKLGG